MLFFSSVAVALLVHAATAQSPPGFIPKVSQNLGASFSSQKLTPGLTLPLRELKNAPRLSLDSQPAGPFLVVMMDFSVEIPTYPHNQTLLHWMQPDLSAAGLSLQSSDPAVAPYFAPAPPPGQTHTYGLFLYKQPSETFEIPHDYREYFHNLTTSVDNRVGFSLGSFVLSADLGQPLAASWFDASAPKNASTTSGGSSAANATGSVNGGALSSPSATQSMPSKAVNTSPSAATVRAASAGVPSSNGLFTVILGVGMTLLTSLL